MNVCTNPDILRVIAFFLKIIDIVKIILPIGLIVMGIIDFTKSVISNDEREQKKNTGAFVNRIIFAVLIFMVPTIVQAVMITLGDITGEVNYTDCLENTKNIAYYDEIAKSNKTSEGINPLEVENIENEVIKRNSTSNSLSDGSFLGQKYNLTNSQLKQIAMVCQREQGSAIGSAAEASLMANRFELYGKKFGEGSDGLYNYVRNSGWFSNAKKKMSDTSSLKESVLTAVHEVLIQGKRTLPLYVDEHDCIDCGSHGFDITKIIVGGKIITSESGLLDQNNYISNETVLYNRYGSIYTFYSFPTKSSDPFGYTENAKKKYNSLNG